MGARQNFIVAVPRCWERARGVLAALQDLVEEWMGSLHTISVQNFSTGSAEDRVLQGAVVADALPHVSDEEIVAFYPSDPKRGSVLVAHEGPYDLILLSFREHVPTLDRLKQIWSIVGREADVVLAGEELEVEGEQVTALLESGALPADLDLCEAAIAKLPAATGLTEPGELDHDLLHGGRLLLR